jgi:hypothetical protein
MTLPLTGVLSGRHNATRDLVSKGEWQWGTRGYTVESEANIGMADTTAGNLYYHLACLRLKSEKLASL